MNSANEMSDAITSPPMSRSSPIASENDIPRTDPILATST